MDLCLNYDKSVAMRIGKGCNKSCCNLQAAGNTIQWVKEVKYLGIYIQSGQKCGFNFDKQKAKFYRAANCIFARLGTLENIPVTLYLVHSIALPTLTYGLEALSLTKTQILSLEHPWSRMFMKLFKTFNLAVIQQCQFFCKLLPIRHLYTVHRMRFLNNLENSLNPPVYHIHQCRSAEHDIISNLAEQYNCCKSIFKKDYNNIIETKFKKEMPV